MNDPMVFVKLAGSIWLFVEAAKKTTLKPLKEKLGISDTVYMVIIRIAVFMIALAITVSEELDYLASMNVTSFHPYLGAVAFAVVVAGGSQLAEWIFNKRKIFGEIEGINLPGWIISISDKKEGGNA